MRNLFYLRPVRALALAALFGLVSTAAWGFGNLSAKGSAEKASRPIRGIALMEIQKNNLVPGGMARAALVVGVNSGFHLNSDHPPLDWITPTKLTFEKHPWLQVTGVDFPEPRQVKFSFLEEPLPVFEKMVPIGLTIRVLDSAGAGATILRGTLSYQACDDKVCLPPAQKSFTLNLVVLPAPAEGGESGPTPGSAKVLTEEETSPSQEDRAPPEEEKSEGGNSLWLILLTAFLGGLALNLTPCVYPLVPITVAYFGGQSRSKFQLAGHGAAYLAGITVTYTILGTFAALSGRLMGEALQHPLTLLLVAGVLLLLSASMFGLYELRLPGWLNRLGGAGASKKGLAGSLIMGLTLGLVAAPCIGPFTLGMLTFVAQRGDPLVGAAIFAALSLGLGLPLALLGFFSSRLLGILPSSGPWMEWTRKLLGAILVFMAVYLLRPLLGEWLWPWASGAALALGAVLALVGGRGVHWAARLIVAALFVGLAFYLVHAAVLTESAHWPEYSPAALEKAKAEGRPAVLDFMADWCSPCRELAKTMAVPEVRELTGMVVALRVDLSDWDSPEEIKLRRRFGIRGVPTLVFIGPDGRERTDLRVIGAMSPAVIIKRFEALLAPQKK